MNLGFAPGGSAFESRQGHLCATILLRRVLGAGIPRHLAGPVPVRGSTAGARSWLGVALVAGQPLLAAPLAAIAPNRHLHLGHATSMYVQTIAVNPQTRTVGSTMMVVPTVFDVGSHRGSAAGQGATHRSNHQAGARQRPLEGPLADRQRHHLLGCRHPRRLMVLHLAPTSRNARAPVSTPWRSRSRCSASPTATA